MYDQQTSAYLDGTMFKKTRVRVGLGVTIEE
jgi:hypothetical protein